MTPWKNLTPERKSLYIGLIVYAVGIAIFFPFVFFNGWYYLLTGWLLGMVINLLNYMLINCQSHMLKNVALGNNSRGALMPLMYMLRFGLYIAGMLLVGILHNQGLDYFNIFTTFGAYLVISAIIFLSGFIAKKPGAPKA